jgi:hypothetical protein
MVVTGCSALIDLGRYVLAVVSTDCLLVGWGDICVCVGSWFKGGELNGKIVARMSEVG